MRVGDVDILPVLDGTAYPSVESVVRHPEGRVWDCHQHPADSRGRLRLDMGSFLLRIAHRTVLIDAGGGVFSAEGTTTGALIDNLRRRGVEPGDVTDIFLTHMHWDHVGWLTTDGQVTFANATVHVHEDDWEYFMTGPTAVEQVRDMVRPTEPHVQTFDVETELLPGLIARPAPGHTPGTTIYLVSSAGQRAVLLGDTAHTVGQLTEPEWLGMYDVDPIAARAMRNLLAEELIETGDPFAPAHLPGQGFGRLVTIEAMRRFVWAQVKAG